MIMMSFKTNIFILAASASAVERFELAMSEFWIQHTADSLTDILRLVPKKRSQIMYKAKNFKSSKLAAQDEK